jgi:DNA repair photolyase
MRAIRTQARPHVRRVEELIAWPTDPGESWCRGFLAGIYDAEGHLGQVIRISNGNAELIAWMHRCLDILRVPHVLEPPRPNGVQNARVTGGLKEIVRFVLLVDPATPRKRDIVGRAMKGSGARRVVEIESLGFELPMYDITTGTGDFIANGVVSHNCFARPTHTYLDLDAGRDFEEKIVVKVNAVSRLRAELDPRRWRGDLIAMGTNTDPYQRCEGKYRLTRGIVEVLAEQRNPFSILTKSTLVLRDLDVLAEAATHDLVRVNLSIGTLDDDVWRTTEPGTPHPRQRVKAVAQLNEAGVPTGVLVAPVLPKLSDRPDQLREVVEACVDAGAVSIGGVPLHLRPGVKEVFFERLRETHPHLVDDYRRMYPRTHASKAYRQRVAVTIRRAAGTSDPRPSPSPPPSPRPSRRIDEQLRLL